MKYKNKIKKNLWDLKYQRHLQKSHTFLHVGLAFALGIPAIILAMIQTKLILLPKISAIFLIIFFFLCPMPFTYALINRERRYRKRITNWIINLNN